MRVTVVTHEMHALDQALIRHVGIEPSSCKILALKFSAYFRADLQPTAEAVIVAGAPGPVVADPAYPRAIGDTKRPGELTLADMLDQKPQGAGRFAPGGMVVGGKLWHTADHGKV